MPAGNPDLRPMGPLLPHPELPVVSAPMIQTEPAWPPALPPVPVMDGVWVAYFGDGSSYVVFDNELEALRRAVDCGMKCTFVKFGEELPRDY